MLDRLRPQLEKLASSAREALKRPGGERRTDAQQPASAAVERGSPGVIKPARPPKPSPGPERRQSWLRPKPVQYNDGRIEVSVRWPVAVGVGLLLFVVLLVVYRLGHLGGRAEFAAPLDSESARPVPQQSAAADRAAQKGVSGETGDDAAASQTAGSTGDHVIVLAHHATRTQLVPVQEHFRRHGVGTAIIAFERLRQYFGDRGLSTGAVPRGDGFMLITDRGYENPVRPGTDGYAVRQKIKEIGAQYEAPEGYESFAPNRFADAYGMKLQ